jgi:hypothetical protein
MQIEVFTVVVINQPKEGINNQQKVDKILEDCSPRKDTGGKVNEKCLRTLSSICSDKRL